MAEQSADTTNAGMYRSPISDRMNVRFTENHITIDRAAQEVFDWVTTWGNVPKWLPVATSVSATRGNVETPSKLGDVVLEKIDPTKTDGIDKQYTVVAQVDGLLQTVAGGDSIGGRPSDRVQYISTFAVKPIDQRSCVLTRIFQAIRIDTVNPVERGAVEDPAVIQKGLEQLKKAIENS